MGFLAEFFRHWKGVLPSESCGKRGFKARAEVAGNKVVATNTRRNEKGLALR